MDDTLGWIVEALLIVGLGGLALAGLAALAVRAVEGWLLDWWDGLVYTLLFLAALGLAGFFALGVYWVGTGQIS